MRYILSILLLIIISTCFAQNKIRTLNDCMKYAVENSPKKNKQTAQNNIYHQNYMEAIGNLLPSINAKTDMNLNFGRGLDSETNAYTDINSFSNNYALFSSLTLFDGLSNINRMKMQKINKLMGEEQLQSTTDMIAFETMEKFYDVLYFAEMVTLVEQQLAESSNNLKQIKRMEELGLKGISDVAEMAAKEAADQYKLTKQKNIYKIGIILLKEKMNYPIDQPLEIERDTLKALVGSEESGYSIYEYARTHNPKVKETEYALKVQELNYNASKGYLLPRVSVDAGYSTNFSRYMDGSEYIPFTDQLKNKRGYYVGFTLSVPLFNGFSNWASIKRNKAQVIISQNDHIESLQTLYSEIEQAVSDLNGLADEYMQAKKQTDFTKTAHKINQRKYTEGLISAIELHTSSNRVLEAETNEINARLQYEVKSKLINYYKGIPFITE